MLLLKHATAKEMLMAGSYCIIDITTHVMYSTSKCQQRKGCLPSPPNPKAAQGVVAHMVTPSTSAQVLPAGMVSTQPNE